MRTPTLLLSGILIAALNVGGCQYIDMPTSNDGSSFPASTPPIIPDGTTGPARYIVVLNDDEVGPSPVGSAITELAGQLGLNADDVFTSAINGFSTTLDAAAVARLLLNPRVKSVEPDYQVQLVTYPVKSTWQSSGQLMPWGVKRVGGARDGTGKVAWILDTGLDLYNADLNIDLKRSRNFVPDRHSTAHDGNGHGTHIGGTIGAKDNRTGVVGVAPNATLVAVRVLDDRGSGYYSSILNGLDYVAASAKAGDVVNLSLGGPASSALDAAVRRVAARGVKVVIAAGNSSSNSYYNSPARVNASNIYTVSAIDNRDRYASFSNYGSVVDVAAPGVGIPSTRVGGGIVGMSGTSMAAPHVAGLLLHGYVATNGKASYDPDGAADWIAHR